MFTDYLAEFLLIASVHLLAVIAPGPDFAIIIRQSLHYGREIGIITACGIGCGLGLHVIYSLIGLSALIFANKWMQLAVEIIGSGYLLYLGSLFIYSRFNKKSSNLNNDSKIKPAFTLTKSSFWLGFFTNATNPKAFLFFLAIFTSIINVDTPFGVKALYGIWMCLVTIIWFSLVSLIFTNKVIQDKFMRFNIWFEFITGVILVSVALYMIINLVLNFTY